MYLLFRYHNITPRQFYDMEPGEKKVIRAFARYEMEKRQEEAKQMSEGAGE